VTAYNYCAKCGKQLVAPRGGEDAYCLACGWRPGGINPDNMFESLSTAEIVGSAATKIAGLRRQVAELDASRRDLLEEIARWERLVKFVSPSMAPRERRRGPKGEAPTPVPESQRWTCSICGWKAAGRYPGRHAMTAKCAGATNAAGVPA